MSKGIGVVVPGASGRMGQMLIREVQASDDMHLVAVLEREGHDWIGQDIGTVMGGTEYGLTVSDDPVTAMAAADAVLDFTAPAATLELALLSAQARIVHVIGTTGFSHEELAALNPAARHATIIRAGNMSLGVNLLVELTRQAAAALGEAYDIEIVETHHRHKVDAPSGTALMLGEAAADARNVALSAVSDRGRDGITGARETGKIGFAALRGGDVVGEHEVMFLGDGERISLGHIATDRALFARGAMRAALWGIGKPPGLYSMRDVLGFAATHTE